jgi:hypothetical protein
MLPIRKNPAVIDQRVIEYVLALTDGGNRSNHCSTSACRRRCTRPQVKVRRH